MRLAHELVDRSRLALHRRRVDRLVLAPKRSRGPHVALFLACVLAGSSAWLAVTSPSRHKPTEAAVVALGDSYSAGAGASAAMRRWVAAFVYDADGNGMDDVIVLGPSAVSTDASAPADAQPLSPGTNRLLRGTDGTVYAVVGDGVRHWIPQGKSAMWLATSKGWVGTRLAAPTPGQEAGDQARQEADPGAPAAEPVSITTMLRQTGLGPADQRAIADAIAERLRASEGWSTKDVVLVTAGVVGSAACLFQALVLVYFERRHRREHDLAEARIALYEEKLRALEAQRRHWWSRGSK